MRQMLTVAAAVLLGASALMAFDQAKFEAGKELFKRCAPCHGQYGEERAMGKSGEISRLGEADIVVILEAYVKGGSEGAMKAQASLLDKDKIASLATYISNMTTQLGEQLYTIRCAGCHGKAGEKAAFGKSGQLSKLSESQIVDILNKYRNGTYAQGTTQAAMKGRAISLSDHDVTALARYISTLK